MGDSWRTFGTPMDSSRHHALKTRMEDLHGTVDAIQQTGNHGLALIRQTRMAIFHHNCRDCRCPWSCSSRCQRVLQEIWHSRACAETAELRPAKLHNARGNPCRVKLLVGESAGWHGCRLLIVFFWVQYVRYEGYCFDDYWLIFMGYCPNMRTQPSNVWIYNQPTSHSMRISWDIWGKNLQRDDVAVETPSCSFSLLQKQINMGNAPCHCSLENEIHGILGCPICRLTHMYECIWIVHILKTSRSGVLPSAS